MSHHQRLCRPSDRNQRAWRILMSDIEAVLKYRVKYHDACRENVRNFWVETEAMKANEMSICGTLEAVTR